MPDQKDSTEVTRLTDLEIKEVSLVDHPANEEIFLIMKRLDNKLRHIDKARWSTAEINELPDSSFLYITPGGEKEDGRTTPRSLRHFPYRDGEGAVDLPHLRNALARIPQSDVPDSVKERLTREAQRLLEEENEKTGRAEKSMTENPYSPVTHLEGRDMIRKDSPIVKAAAAATNQNEAEKAKEEAKPQKKNVAQAAKMAEAAIGLAEALSKKADGMVDWDEYKALHTALTELKEYFASMAEADEVEGSAAGADKAKADDEEEEKDKDADAEAATKAEAKEGEEEKEEDDAKEAKKDSEGAAQAAAPSTPNDSEGAELSEIRNLLAQLHSKLGPAAEAEKANGAEQEVAKGINALGERINRFSDRLQMIEKTRGVSRGEADTATSLEKSGGKSNLFAGLL